MASIARMIGAAMVSAIGLGMAVSLGAALIHLGEGRQRPLSDQQQDREQKREG